MTSAGFSEDDPLLTTREAAQLLGVSIKTAQVWLEQGGVASWKTPGGHRRARRSAVLAMRKPVNPGAGAHLNQSILLHLKGVDMVARQVQLGETPVSLHTNDGDLLDLLIQVGGVAPALLVLTVSDVDWQKFEMLRRIMATPRLAHTHVIAFSALTERALRSEIGTTERVTLLSLETTAARFVDVVHQRLGWPDVTDAALRAETNGSGGVAALGPFAVPANEAGRLHAVARSALAGAAPERAFDDLTRLAGQTLQTPICLLSILTADQQWFKSHWGLDVSQTPRAWSFCNHTIRSDDVFVVEDATKDARFKDNPLVTGHPHIRFYAGFPVKDVDGFPLGALCVIDRKPRALGREQRDALQTIAASVEDKINLRLRERQLRGAAGAA